MGKFKKWQPFTTNQVCDILLYFLRNLRTLPSGCRSKKFAFQLGDGSLGRGRRAAKIQMESPRNQSSTRGVAVMASPRSPATKPPDLGHQWELWQLWATKGTTFYLVFRQDSRTFGCQTTTVTTSSQAFWASFEQLWMRKHAIFSPWPKIRAL